MTTLAHFSEEELEKGSLGIYSCLEKLIGINGVISSYFCKVQKIPCELLSFFISVDWAEHRVLKT